MIEFSFLLQRASLFGLAALGVALLLQWLLAHRVPPAWRVWIWRVAIIQTALALIPFAPIALSVLPAPAPIVAPMVSEPATLEAPPISDAPIADVLPQAPVVETLPPAMTEAPAVQSAPPIPASPRDSVEIQLSWRAFTAWIYLLGVAIQLALLARGALNVRRKLRACTPLDNAPLRPIAARLKIRKLPRLLQSESGSPFLTGIFRPTIVLPLSLDENHLEAVLAHELAHQRRRDLAWNALLWALQSLLWFHPLSWISRRFHALESESACDELTLQLTQIAPKSYGTLLIGVENVATSPLTAGVNDGFFTLHTRLARLSKSPKMPRRRVRWLCLAALLISFAAVVPIELTARAQNKEAAVAANRKPQDVSGKVVDASGKPLAGATVYALAMRPDSQPLPTVETDSKGQFTLRGAKQGDLDMSVFADAGARGFGESYVSGQADDIVIRLAAPAQVRVRFVDASGRPVPNLKVNLRSIGASTTSWKDLPGSVKQRFQTTTNARGEATFSGLPLGDVAQFTLADTIFKDTIFKDTIFGMGDLRGTRFAPLATEDAVAIQTPLTRQTIRLLNPVRLEGRVALDGKAKGNVLILARRINAAEAAGNTENRERLIAQTRSNAQGKYVMDGLRPGRYGVWVYPEKPAVREFVGPSYERDLKDKINRVDFKLSRGALIQGVIVSKATGKPVKGQTMWLFDSQENNQYVITDARGYFKFRALGGKQRLRVHANGSNSPPPGYVLPAKSEFNFTVKNGEKRDFKIALPGKGVVAPIRGVVVGPDGQPVAGAQVFYRTVGGWGSQLNKSVTTDAQGHFALPDKDSLKPAQLFADKDELTTPYSAIALPGKMAQLQLAADAWASIEGRVTDEKQRPLSGVAVDLTHFYGTTGISGDKTTTDKNGQFRYQRQRPNTSVWVQTNKTGYSQGHALDFTPLPTGQTRRLELTMRRASKTLAGIVYGTDGKPARGYQVNASGQSKTVRTDSNGRFLIPQVMEGKISVWVYGPKSMGISDWPPVSAMGGDQKLVIRLAKVPRDTRYRQVEQSFADAVKPETLIGKAAPPIRATRWAGSRPIALDKLRDKPVFLVIARFDGNDGEVRDFARSFGDRIHFIGVQIQLEAAINSQLKVSAEEAARRMGFPIAVDAVLPAKKFAGWQTAQSYGYAPYVVIGRDGRVLYAGDKLDRAIELATATSK